MQENTVVQETNTINQEQISGQNVVREKKPPRPHKNGSAVRRDDKRPDGQPGTRVKNP